MCPGQSLNPRLAARKWAMGQQSAPTGRWPNRLCQQAVWLSMTRVRKSCRNHAGIFMHVHYCWTVYITAALNQLCVSLINCISESDYAKTKESEWQHYPDPTFLRCSSKTALSCLTDWGHPVDSTALDPNPIKSHFWSTVTWRTEEDGRCSRNGGMEKLISTGIQYRSRQADQHHETS